MLSLDSSSYELSFRYRFEAAHRFTKSCETSCATPHGHTWYAQLDFVAPAVLGPDDMVAEFAQLKSQWKAFLTETVDHSFLHHFEDPILPSLRQHIPHFRALPFPGDPTTEWVAALFFAKAWALHHVWWRKLPLERQHLSPVPVCVRVDETPTNHMAFRAPSQLDLTISLAEQPGFEWLAQLNEAFDGWWQSAVPHDRHLVSRS